jgi:hypothetical protein
LLKQAEKKSPDGDLDWEGSWFGGSWLDGLEPPDDAACGASIEATLPVSVCNQ